MDTNGTRMAIELPFRQIACCNCGVDVLLRRCVAESRLLASAVVWMLELAAVVPMIVQAPITQTFALHGTSCGLVLDEEKAWCLSWRRLVLDLCQRGVGSCSGLGLLSRLGMV